MINVTQKSSNQFLIEWDETDPIESILNNYSEEDFNKLLREYIEEINCKKEYYEGKVNSTKTRGKSQNSNISETTQEDWEDFWNSESEGRDKDYLKAINQETFGQVYHSPEAQGSWD